MKDSNMNLLVEIRRNGEGFGNVCVLGREAKIV